MFSSIHTYSLDPLWNHSTSPRRSVRLPGHSALARRGTDAVERPELLTFAGRWRAMLQYGPVEAVENGGLPRAGTPPGPVASPATRLRAPPTTFWGRTDRPPSEQETGSRGQLWCPEAVNVWWKWLECQLRGDPMVRCTFSLTWSAKCLLAACSM